jgi:hypothetical protein
MRTIIAAITNAQARREDRQGINFVVESTIRGLDHLAVMLRGLLVRVGSVFAPVVGAQPAPAMACQGATLAGKHWHAGLGTHKSLGLLPAGSYGNPAGTGRYFAG